MRQSRDIRASVALSFIFSPVSREVFARLSGPLCDTRTTFVRVSQKFRIVNSPKFRGNKFATLARTSRDRRTTVARQSCEIFWRKNWHKIFQHVEKLRDKFATQENSHDTRATLARMSCESPRQISQNSREKFACQ